MKRLYNIFALLFQSFWNFLLFLIELPFRLIAVLAGVILIALGIALCMTVIGAIIGVPLILLGCLLMIKSFF